jgi:hypothetical protein
MRDGGRRRRAGKRERAVSYANGWVAYAERAGRRARTWSEESPSEQMCYNSTPALLARGSRVLLVVTR